MVLTTTWPRSANAFYGPVIDQFHSRGYDVHVVTSDGPEVPSLRKRADVVHIIAMERAISPLSDLRALLAWLRLLHALKPDLVLQPWTEAPDLDANAKRFTDAADSFRFPKPESPPESAKSATPVGK